MMKNKKSASALISDLKRKTRKAYNSEDNHFSKLCYLSAFPSLILREAIACYLVNKL